MCPERYLYLVSFSDDIPKLISKMTNTELIEVMQLLGSKAGFIAFYYKNLKHFKTYKNCFDFVNQLHFELFDDFRYANYNSFRFTL